MCKNIFTINKSKQKKTSTKRSAQIYPTLCYFAVKHKYNIDNRIF